MVNRFTPKSQQALNAAKKSAEKMGHTYIGTEHLLLGILTTDCVGAKILDDKKISYTDVYDCLTRISGVGSLSALSCRELTPKCKKIIEAAAVYAKKFGSRFIGTEHILYAICDDAESVGAKILTALGMNMQTMKNEIAAFLDSGTDGAQNIKDNVPGSPTLSMYGKNLNVPAKEGKSDPLIGREKEVERLIQILSRRTKNNPCLIGEPGVGKTAIIEGLAKKIVDGEAPENLLNKTIVSLDLASMIAGAKYRGEFEERMRGVMNELKNNDSLILFIDEIHTIIGAGAAEGAVDAANIIKPVLARGQIQVIGATTVEEYRRIEKDPALERRFQPMMIEEPTEEETLEILKGLRPKYEEHHGVKISDGALHSAVSLSVRYINDRFLPDKAIDLIDEASSRLKMRRFFKTPDLKKTEERIKELSKEKEQAILEENFELASKIRDDEVMLKIKYNKEKSQREKQLKDEIPTVSENDICDIVTMWTSIPVSKLEKEESEKLKNLEEMLSSRVIGQSEAIKTVSASIKRGRLGLKNPNRPIGSFLFLGPTGVGKSELAKSIADVVFGSVDSMIRIDMSEYMEKHSASKLIGSPPGYVGYGEGGQLTEAVRRKPYSVILFDEIEKAHPDVYNILLQVLEDGILTDSGGRRVDFRNTIMILTSNIGAKNITEPKRLGFSGNLGEQSEYEYMKSQINDALKTEFRPEFLNRLDEIIIFDKLSPDDTKNIARLMLNDVKKLALNIGVNADFDESAVSFLAEKGYDKIYGARPLRRAVTTYVENTLSEKILSGEISSGDKIEAYSDGEKIFYRKKDALPIC
ncbi:MAG: ATP-dependent Clp protease ATP-binding subunit [Eubacteriales bacterium]